MKKFIERFSDFVKDSIPWFNCIAFKEFITFQGICRSQTALGAYCRRMSAKSGKPGTVR